MSNHDDIGIIGVAPEAPARTAPEFDWTKEIVLERLAEGIKIVHRTAGRTGPRAFGNGMPTFLVFLDEELGKGYHESEPVRLPPSARQIKLAEEACEWPARFVADLRVREALHIWMAAKALRRPWQKLAEQRGWAKETAKRYRERAIYQVVTGLSAACIPVDRGKR
ncbi:MAG: hypothetical protein DI527_00410 [Chelatococcus sp.]|nr:MAG: hypothetical protein DI527_00410 [Chelatococcus sp.]